VFKRHFTSIHGYSKEYFDRRFPSSHRTGKAYGVSTPDLFFRYITRQSHEDDIFEETMKTFRVIQNFSATRNIIDVRIQNSNLTNTLQNTYCNFLQYPRAQISGFSGYICQRCITYEVVHIKDLGFDLTAEGRHQCQSNRIEEAKKLLEGDKNILQELKRRSYANLNLITDWWLQGKKILVARRISPSQFSHFDLGSHTRFPFVNILCVDEPWLEKVKACPIELDHRSLTDFIQRVCGTYGMFPILGSLDYFLIYIAGPGRQLKYSDVY